MTNIRKDVPVICAECKHATIKGKYLYCDKESKTVYNAKPKWCSLPSLYAEDTEQSS